MIKRIACLSTIKPAQTGHSYSEQVFSVFDSARRYNKEHHLVGVFLVCNDVLLQIIEGEPSALASATYRVNRDPRIVDVSVIANERLDAPVFTRWSLKLLNESCDAHADYVQKLKKLLGGTLNNCSAADRFRLDKIFRLQTPVSNYFSGASIAEDLSMAGGAAPDFSGQAVTMKSWPRPTHLRLNAPLMKLCPLLIARVVTYERLVALKVLPETELREQLTALYEANALEVVVGRQLDNVRSIPSPPKPSTPSRSGGRFSQALKSFIQNHKARG